MPCYQLVKELTLSRCIAQISSTDKEFSLDAARTENAMREWVASKIDSGDSKINALINSCKLKENYLYNDSGVIPGGYMMNCLRLYHSPQLDKLSRTVIYANLFSTWYKNHAH